MLLTITTTHRPAIDLGYLLHKHPDRCQSFPMTFGQAHVFYPEANIERCTAALLLDIDPISLVRGKDRTLDHYVNDRPYVASSFLSVAISKIFRTAMSGHCKERPELVETVIPLIARLSVIPCHSGENFLRNLFKPLGYQVNVQELILDKHFPEWGSSIYFSVELQHVTKLSDLLSHLYVLIPVLDDDKHYWIGDDEVEKLLRHGEGWLSTHPAREIITKRYLKRQHRLTQMALLQLVEAEDPDPDATEEVNAQHEEVVEQSISLNQQRLEAVTAALKQTRSKRVIDLGCGGGKLLRWLLKDLFFEQITGMDVSHRSLEITQQRLHLDQLPTKQQNRIQLIQGSLIYRDQRLVGYDAATVVEVIEHLDLNRLASFERVLFEFSQPKVVIITTPNIEYNIRFENLPLGKLRHLDHRFEWNRQEFQAWAHQITRRFGYTVEFHSIGTEDPEVGSPTQMGVFTR